MTGTAGVRRAVAVERPSRRPSAALRTPFPWVHVTGTTGKTTTSRTMAAASRRAVETGAAVLFTTGAVTAGETRALLRPDVSR